MSLNEQRLPSFFPGQGIAPIPRQTQVSVHPKQSPGGAPQGGPPTLENTKDRPRGPPSRCNAAQGDSASRDESHPASHLRDRDAKKETDRDRETEREDSGRDRGRETIPENAQ